MKKRLFWWLTLSLVILLIFLAGCGAKTEEAGKLPSDVIVLHRGATAGVGPILIAFAELTTKYTKMQATAQESSGSKIALQSLQEKKADYIGTNSVSLRDAYFGVGEFDTPFDVNQVAVITLNMFAFQARGGTGINKIEDLKGKKVMCNSPPQPWLIGVSKGLLEFYGVGWTGAQVLETTGAPEYHKAAMLDRRADAFMGVCSGGYRVEIAKSVGLTTLSVSKEAIEYVRSKYEPMVFYIPLTPRLASEVGMDPKVEVGVVGVKTNICCRASLPEEAVYQSLKAMYDHPDELKSYGKICEDATLQLATTDIPVPMHPGAIKYYKEKGVWTAELEKANDAVLAKPRGKPKS